MSYSIRIDHENQVLDYKHAGIIDKEQIGEAWRELLDLKEFTSSKYNLMSDYSEAAFNMDIGDVQLISDFLYTLRDVIKDKKQALIVDKPFNTVVSMLFEGAVYEKTGFIVKTFSTRKAALRWLTA